MVESGASDEPQLWKDRMCSFSSQTCGSKVHLDHLDFLLASGAKGDWTGVSGESRGGMCGESSDFTPVSQEGAWGAEA